mmetsp:Transcript_11444/g.27318  ORF Transcript_11444/g.27318 Transcript_11444/m.27318 type:complete len:111 (-) Transcript_11444:359-691(-)
MGSLKGAFGGGTISDAHVGRLSSQSEHIMFSGSCINSFSSALISSWVNVVVAIDDDMSVGFFLGGDWECCMFVVAFMRYFYVGGVVLGGFRFQIVPSWILMPTQRHRQQY